jgi:two-component system response regulator DesR
LIKEKKFNRVAVKDNKIRILLVDDQISTRRALKALFTYEPRIEVIGEAGDGKGAVRLAGELCPDLILMDVKMPFMDGIEATRQIKSASPLIKIVVYTMYLGSQKEAYQAGADYFLIKGSQGLTPTQIILSFFP